MKPPPSAAGGPDGRLPRRRWLAQLGGPSLALLALWARAPVAGGAAATAVTAALVAGCGRKPARARAVPGGATVLALGDSLTHGTGAPAEAAYPALLAAMTGWQIVNAGVPGDTSERALQRLPALLQEHAPQLVLLGIGGNDFLRRQPEDETRANLRRIVEAARAAGAQVLLIAVPRPSLAAAFVGSLSDHPMYAELAEQLQLPLHAGGWAEVLSDPGLRSDQIHANAQGYRRFAEGLRATAARSGLLAR